MLEQHKAYESRAMKLQNEINEHRTRLFKENQEMLGANMAQKDEFRRKLKKREAKIDKYKTLNKQLGRENTEMKLRLDDMQQKMINVRMKMESKVQEKEFKLMMIKNQMKQLQQVQATIPQNLNMTGILTPGGAGGSVSHNQSMNKVQSQNQLLNMLSSLIQKGQAQQQEEDQERKRSQEPIVK